MCSARRYGSTDMQTDPCRSGHDIDLRSNFQNDFSGYRITQRTYNSFDASRRQEHYAAKSDVVALLSQKLLPIFFFVKTAIFQL